ncbi:phage portal protein [Mycolicibacterium brisbanense]|uniref:Phage portal protein n=1 Tax=Mycolicibacterium brisbanense TaxID=146020 RepID=A0A100VZR5_9MYCO|nr:phage portal protein [Mycolicibacterium brisbanense]MCV7156139.1 phage portal protein [Mycolicibacterium brisbanense]GAS88896.1 hypothetical protein RMCB_2992 [Mycolicibacterium brisbanense]
MTTPDLLVELLQKLDSGAHHRHTLNLYYRGQQPLAFLSPESKLALNNRFGRIASNIPRLAVTSLAERLRVSGFVGDDVWDEFLASDLDQLSGVAHREALTLGQAFVIVWADAEGKPRATVESAEQVTVKRDPVSRDVLAAVKRIRTKTTTEAWLYLPEEIQHYRANTPGAAAAGFELVESLPNPLGVVPVVPITNSDRLLDVDGCSEIEDLRPLVDGLCKTLADLAVAQEYTARPRRWATGIELTEVPRLDDNGNVVTDPETGLPVMDTVNPIPEGNRAMVSENDQAKFGQLEGANLAGYEAAVRIWLGQIMAVSALPSHFLGILSDQPTSAEALRASEASLTARAEARQLTFGRAWEQVARLLVSVRDGVVPADVTVGVVWADASTRSVAAEADAAVKLYQANILSRRATLQRLGLSDDQIAAELTAIDQDAQNARDIILGRTMSSLQDR